MRDKQFGQRTEGITREGLRNIQGVALEQIGDDNSNESTSNLRRMVFWIGGAALLIGIYVGTTGSGQGLSQYWKQNGGAVADEIYVPIGAKDVFSTRPTRPAARAATPPVSVRSARPPATWPASPPRTRSACARPRIARISSRRCGTTIACRRKAARPRSEPIRKSRRRSRPSSPTATSRAVTSSRRGRAILKPRCAARSLRAAAADAAFDPVTRP